MSNVWPALYVHRDTVISRACLEPVLIDRGRIEIRPSPPRVQLLCPFRKPTPRPEKPRQGRGCTAVGPNYPCGGSRPVEVPVDRLGVGYSGDDNGGHEMEMDCC